MCISTFFSLFLSVLFCILLNHGLVLFSLYINTHWSFPILDHDFYNFFFPLSFCIIQLLEKKNSTKPFFPSHSVTINLFFATYWTVKKIHHLHSSDFHYITYTISILERKSFFHSLFTIKDFFFLILINSTTTITSNYFHYFISPSLIHIVINLTMY